MNKIEMVDLNSQYKKIKLEIDQAMLNCVEASDFINGQPVTTFCNNLKNYAGAKHVIPCGNGTDALLIALMALELKPGDEVIIPAFTYVATAEVIALLRLVPIMVDVSDSDFNIDLSRVKNLIGPRTKVIVPVHLFGQCVDMEELLELAAEYNLYVIEDAAQAIGSKYFFKDGTVQQAGTMGHIGTTSFFPSKNLGCFGDGGAIFTNSDSLAEKLKMIANHGQTKKYYHDEVGVNSRLDSLQAAVLNVKLKYLDDYCLARNNAANFYDQGLCEISEIIIPKRSQNSSHVFHQYTLKIANDKRDSLKEFLFQKGVPSMVYYPMPLHFQKAYKSDVYPKGSFPISEKLCVEVLSLPMHTEMNPLIQKYIINVIKEFYNQ